MKDWLKKWFTPARIGVFAAGGALYVVSIFVPPAAAIALPMGTLAIKGALASAGVGIAMTAVPHEVVAKVLPLLKPAGAPSK